MTKGNLTYLEEGGADGSFVSINSTISPSFKLISSELLALYFCHTTKISPAT